MSARMPLYVTIFKTLQGEIEEGLYSKNFPSEAQLVKRFSASRQTVIRAMAELVKAGFVERHRGSGTVVSRKMRQTLGCVGLVLPWFASTPFIGAVSQVCRAEGYTLLFRNISEPSTSVEARAAETRRMVREFAEAKVSGVLLQPLQLVDDAVTANREMLEAFRRRRIPVVLVDHDICYRPESSGCDVVGIDNFRAGYEIGRHLLERGAKRIVFLTRAHWAPTITERLHGVSAAVVEAGAEWRPDRNVVRCEPGDAKAVARLLRRVRPDALVCGNDNAAARLLKTLRTLRVDVPRKVMVTGFDDLPHAALLTPSLTTVRQDFVRLAGVAADMLFRRIRNPDGPTVSIMLPTRLIARESTARG